MKKKKFVLLIFLMICGVSVTEAQKIKKKEIDKFTKEEYVETSYKKLINVFGMLRPHVFKFCIVRKGNTIQMPSRMQFDQENVNIDEESGVILLLSNDDTVRLKTSFIGNVDSLNGFDTGFKLSPEDVEKLINNKVLAIRMVYVGGHYDHDVKGPNQDLISRMIKMVME